MNLSVKEKAEWNAQADSEQRRWLDAVRSDFADFEIAITGHGLIGYALGRRKVSGEWDMKSYAALTIAGIFGLRLPTKENAGA
jgi:hypothetical protein